MDMPKDLYLFDTDCYAQSVSVTLNKFVSEISGSVFECFYSLDGDSLYVGRFSTFGGLYFRGELDENSYEYFANDFLTFLNDFKVVQLRFPPIYLDSRIGLFCSAMERYDFCCYVDTDQYQATCNDIQNFSKSNRKIFRRLAKSGFSTSVEGSLSEAGYNVLKQNRAQRGVELSLSFSQLDYQSKLLTGKYVFFACYAPDGNLCAYAVCVRLSGSVLYVLYWGEAVEYRSASPVVQIAASILDFCSTKDIRWLDAGTSSVDGVPDDGLISFKRHIGFSESQKYSFLRV